MTPVFQTTDELGKGDCFRACVATIFELPIESVPNFNLIGTQTGKEMNEVYEPWFRERGWTYIRVWGKYGLDHFAAVGVYCVFCVTSQRNPGGQHAVVGQWQRHPEGGVHAVVVHDPNRNNSPYDLSDEKTVLWTGLFVPLQLKL